MIEQTLQSSTDNVDGVSFNSHPIQRMPVHQAPNCACIDAHLMAALEMGSYVVVPVRISHKVCITKSSSD